MADALRQVGRESVTVTTKTVSRSASEVRSDVERFLAELGTDYIDILLLHCLTSADWPEEMRGPMDVLSEFKSRGQVRALGCSCHDFGALQAASECDWVDVNLVRINPAGHAMCASPDRVVPVIEAMDARGQGVYGMKVMGGGSELASHPGRAIEFVMDLLAVRLCHRNDGRRRDRVLPRIHKSPRPGLKDRRDFRPVWRSSRNSWPLP